jgi:hypothetical protein
VEITGENRRHIHIALLIGGAVFMQIIHLTE